jgi:hypothetical protein
MSVIHDLGNKLNEDLNRDVLRFVDLCRDFNYDHEHINSMVITVLWEYLAHVMAQSIKSEHLNESCDKFKELVMAYQQEQQPRRRRAQR